MNTKRLSPEETLELINRIPALQALFKPKNRQESGSDESDGITYLSRFNKDIAADSKVKEKKRDVESAEYDASADDVEEVKHEKTATMTTQSKHEKRRLAMSLGTLATKPEKRASLVKEGAIPVLMYMSSIPDRFIQRSVASAFSSLSKEASIRVQMIEEGAFASIIALSNHSNKAIVSDCCRALCNLCCEPGYEHRAVKDGIGFAIIHAITSCPEIVDICLKILLNLSCVSDKYTRLEDVTDTLMHFNAYALSIENEVLVTSAICNLSALKGFQLRLVEDGCLRFVERVMKSTNSRLRKLGSVIVDNLTTENKTRVKLVDNGVISTLLLMSRDEEEDVRTCAVKSFYNLSQEPTCREKIVNANAVTVIIKMSMEKFENMTMGRTASRILRLLCSDNKIAHKLVRDGIIKALMALLRTDDGFIQQNCAESICSLFQLSEVMGRLVEQGAVGILVSLSQNTTDHVTSEWCAFALYHLATNKLCPESMLEPAILPCIIKLCEISSERTKYFCAAALEHITQIKSVDSSESIPILVHMLRNVTDNSTTKTYCAASLYNLADRDENCFMMLEAGALLPVVRLTASDHMQTKMKCAAILSRLSLHQDYYSHFATGDVLRVLLELSCVDHIFTQRKVIIALSNLSQSKELREQLLELNPIPFIMSLASKCDENVRRGCASIVCNLTYEKGSEKASVQAGIVSTLMITAMITSDQVVSKIICVKALVNLMADKTLFKDMVKDGLIWGLSSLAALEDVEMRLLCMKALCCLSVDFTREMLASTPCVRTITRAVGQRADLELLRFGARTLTNILVKTKDSDEAFRRLAVSSMTPLAECEDVEVSEMCILCLCLTSQSESCREGIVKSGMLQKIDASTIFSKPRVSYAYLTMFENIANNPMMRTKLLDEKCISRFSKICALTDPNLDLAVGRAIYCISCAPENIPVLVEQNILQLIQHILEAEYERDSDLTELLVSCLYNLTTHEDCHARLVDHGIVRAIVQLWDLAKEDLTMCTLAIAAISHLACGNVNSARMVREGCTDILCFLIRVKNLAGYPYYSFDIDIHDRVSISFRNLMSVISNQEIMMEAGCLPVIMAMATESFSIIQDSISTTSWAGSDNKHEKRRSSFRSQHAIKRTGYVHPEHYSISKNCASALRSLTYNPTFRDTLVASGALDVILEGEAEDMNIGHALLCDLETESWQNGSRGPQKEGRVLGKRPGAITTDLLGGTRKLKLKDVEIRKVVLEKFHVRVEVEEPTVGLDSSANVIELSIHDLATFGESDDSGIPRLMFCAKQECDIVEDYNSLRFGEAELVGGDDGTGDPTHSGDTAGGLSHGGPDVGSGGSTGVAPGVSFSSASGGSAAGAGGASGGGGSAAAAGGAGAGGGNVSSNRSHASSHDDDSSTLSGFPDIRDNGNNNGLGRTSAPPPHTSSSATSFLPPASSLSNTAGAALGSATTGGAFPAATHTSSSMKKSAAGVSTSSTTDDLRLPGISRSKSMSMSKRKVKNPDKAFKTVLGFIKASRQTNGARIGEVLEKWNEVSKF